MNNASYRRQILGYLKSHKVSFSLFLAGYGAVYLASVILTGWSIFDWGKDVSELPPVATTGVLPRGWVNPLFFVTSLPALLIGTVALCIYSIRDINLHKDDLKQYVAILLAACGFIYCVIGAWPLGAKINFPWEWQKGIISSGAAFAWLLYLLGITSLLVGASSLYFHSRIYYQLYPDDATQEILE